MSVSIYIRTCQECGHAQQERPPATYNSDIWRDKKCKQCKSEALDYGSWQEVRGGGNNGSG